MIFEELAIAGVWKIAAEPFQDDRGVLRRSFCVNEFAAHGLNSQVLQGNISENFQRHTLRGFHYQNPPFQEAKTLTCVSGAAHAVVADLRPESKTYLKWQALEIAAANRLSLHIPFGCAMAFLTLEDNTVLHYYMSEVFDPASYGGLRYNDPALAVTWPAEPRIISAKDRSYPDYVPSR